MTRRSEQIEGKLAEMVGAGGLESLLRSVRSSALASQVSTRQGSRCSSCRSDAGLLPGRTARSTCAVARGDH